MNKITVMVADDSALMRRMVSDMVNMESDMEVVDIARDGEDLLNKLRNRVPDIVTLDVEMPRLNGIEALKKIIEAKIPVKVIMLSSLTKDGAEITIECLQAGAVDFVQKPGGSISLDINKVREELISKIRMAKGIKRTITGTIYPSKTSDSTNQMRKIEEKNGTTSQVHHETKREGYSKLDNSLTKKSAFIRRVEKVEAIVIGASTGGPKALYEVITKLPENLGVPVFVVQHMPVGFTKAFAERLDKFSKLKVVEATHGLKIEKNVIYVAPGGSHMEVSSDKTIRLTQEPAIWGVRPAVDKLFISAAKVFNGKLLGVVLTGMGKDGSNGVVEIKNRGGYNISEDESTCTIYGMPKAAYETHMVDEVVPLYNITDRIVNVVGGR
ncbi:chemotaxis response regulator protein-glutamate methylesterase [Clostridium punense]|uniref:protein-glutamate methylesterase/protein-glutamine glutaminase n=1 Tax=Clostridium TaxID=1485 RepID=UPI0004CF1F5D|nr:chemotaxis response regulator protein-glutamate methylesterase [Clostridium sp. BL8]